MRMGIGMVFIWVGMDGEGLVKRWVEGGEGVCGISEESDGMIWVGREKGV